ncbi:hypothetical protein BDN72DRAFT_768746 [Pluteus cervinus]|uniref:Uncharacterized protein n=1 Tax=Pluteus cervinus TaxID=181527 RepID=A0ACD3AU91_9AGAR|nr:hypothetical protein BDN72DRAFT_768746 [Pluteus cervinus]
MELSLEAYRNIVKNVGSRADIVTLCRVSKGFQNVAERALYNTLYVRHDQDTVALCHTLTNTPRLSVLVDALTIDLTNEVDSSEDESDSHERVSLPEGYWDLVAGALQHTTQLHFFTIDVDNAFDSSTAWILNNCTFQLKNFHCGLDWDHHLVTFLNTQIELHDLYIIDYNDSRPETPTTSNVASSSMPSPSLTIDSHSLPNLSTLHCTFSEAAVALVPGRPITHLKTCFSRSKLEDKREEMATLFSKIGESTKPLLSLDIADSSYTDSFSMELLNVTVNTPKTTTHLRHLGTLVLPINGKERLKCYSLLMRLPHLRCLEVEISDWDPAPSTLPGFRALASEMKLYRPTLIHVVFVQFAQDYERTVLTATAGVWRLDAEISADTLWREI